MRRMFIKAGLAGLALGSGIGRALAATAAEVYSRTPDDIARLAVVNMHTGESLDLVYREGPRYLTDAMGEIDRVLRDHRTGDVHPMDPQLLDQLDRLAALLEVSGKQFEVISGYRSPATNAKLAARSSGVAKNSFHMSGRAIDIRLPGVKLSELRRAALRLHAGGVGYYPKSSFVHLDTGPLRSWRG